ncbi:MAG: hypothetical protein ACKOFW_05215, partial [Planctomycetaceae bacterium]
MSLTTRRFRPVASQPTSPARSAQIEACRQQANATREDWAFVGLSLVAPARKASHVSLAERLARRPPR